MKEVEKIFINKPALAAFPTPDDRFTDTEYLRLALSLKVKGKVEMKREERDDNYKIDLYFEHTVLDGEHIDTLLHLMRASEMYTLTVLKQRPQTIRLTCYRLKREEM